MKRTNIRVATRSENRLNRLLVALAAAWMILSLALGGAIGADASDAGGATAPAPITRTAQP